MKLNKVLALALSGVMAVSMLAGCKGSTTDNGDQGQDQEIVADTTIAGKLNDKLLDKNVYPDVLTFSYSTKVENAMKEVAKTNGGLKQEFDGQEDDAAKQIADYLGITGDRVALADLGSNKTAPVVGTEYAISVQIYKQLTEDGAMKSAVNDLANWIANVDPDDKVEINGLEYKFTYTGEVAMISADDDGTPVYAVVAVIKCDTAAPVKA